LKPAQSTGLPKDSRARVDEESGIRQRGVSRSSYKCARVGPAASDSPPTERLRRSVTYKTNTWFSRNNDVSLGDFRRRWLDSHVVLVLDLPGVLRYGVNTTTDAAYGGRQPFCDGVAEVWWESAEARAAANGSPGLALVREHMTTLVDVASIRSLPVNEIVVTDGSPGAEPLKQFTWLRRRHDMSLADAQAHWRTKHAAIAATVPGLVRYVQCHASVEAPADTELEWMGMPISWFDDLETARTAALSSELGATRADEHNFLSGDRLPWVITSERIFDNS